MNSENNLNNSQRPQEFFDDSSFKTLYGGVVVTWVATSAIADVWGSVDPKMLGFVVALVVALVGFFISEQRNLKKLVVTPFNGLLIYLTIMGGTSFLPPPTSPDTPVDSSPTAVTDSVATPPADGESVKPVYPKSRFLTSWNVSTELVSQINQQKEENRELHVKTEQLQQVNQTYEAKLDSTRRVINTLQLSPDVQKSLLKNLNVSSQLNNLPFN